ncbi:hypothetical protein, partial [Sutterella wadsworthensis]|uniref:hypothetical protein n=1 Tax=Sutterella wadsworthensis TaxID=40545 RepID=UPI003AF166ED
MPPKQHQTRSAADERLVSRLSPFDGFHKRVGRIPIAECAQPAQKKVYGFRDLLRSLSRSLAGDSAEHDDVRVGIAAQTVCA